MKGTAKKEGIDCDLLLGRMYGVYVDQQQADEVKGIYKRQLEGGLDYIQDVMFVGEKYAERVSLP